MADDSPLARGRRAHRRHSWSSALNALRDADRQAPLDADDLEAAATAAYLAGHDSESHELLERAFHERLRRGEPERATWIAHWIGVSILDRGEVALGSGWFAQGQRVLDEAEIGDCAARGYLVSATSLLSLGQGDAAGALAGFGEAGALARRFSDPTLATMSLLGQGLSLLNLGRTAEGIAHLDEAMVTVLGDRVFPIAAGIVYCAAIEACHNVFDLRRAREWTTSLSRWCDSQPGLVQYRGQCLSRRSEIMRLHGDWSDAATEADRACSRLADPPGQSGTGDAHYQRAELHRLRGQFASAEEAYREANRYGRTPEPGIALLRLAQGSVDKAAAISARATAEAEDDLSRARLLSAHCEIMLAAGDDGAARSAATELGEIARRLNAPYLLAAARGATGAVLLASGDARPALSELRGAWLAWQDLDAPYEAARTRILIGSACRAIGDEATAALEFDAALWAFRTLEAIPDAVLAESLLERREAAPAGLTARELDVLTLIAEGRTNREIAGALIISEKTVARHISNIFAKLDVSSRTAAAAYAYEHGLAGQRRNG